jgi:hypothetical protein
MRSPIKEIADECRCGIVSTIELDASQFSPDCTVELSLTMSRSSTLAKPEARRFGAPCVVNRFTAAKYIVS